MRVAVIDIGSNSIKSLVADGANATPVHEAFAEARLLGGNVPEQDGKISAERFAAGVAAVKKLFDDAQKFSPARVEIVGTSVFRTAKNAREFSAAIAKETGISVRVLSGDEEAAEIARGVATDPLVRALEKPAAIFDLGGGSLEFISAGARFRKSWALGAVRLMREFVKNPDSAIPQRELAAVRSRVRETAGAELAAHTSANSAAVVCGGALAVVHAIFAAAEEVSPTLFPRTIPLVRMKILLDRLASRTREERLKFPALPPARADILPVALAVLSEIAEICGFAQFVYSPRNLRYGIAAELA